MNENLEAEINLNQLKNNFLQYTRRAFNILPQLKKPHMLDIGCGSGFPTIELAKLSDGEIIGIDIDQSLLNKLNKKIEKQGLSNRIKTIKCSAFEMDFSDESFDIIWAEGMQFLGFEKRLKDWKKFLKLDGYLILHDGIKNVPSKLKSIPKCGYKLLEYFTLPEDVWWTDYYYPLENRLKNLRSKIYNDTENLKAIKKLQDEVNFVKKNPKTARSLFYIMQRQI